MDQATYNRKAGIVLAAIDAAGDWAAERQRLREAARDLDAKRLDIVARLDQAGAAIQEMRAGIDSA